MKITLCVLLQPTYWEYPRKPLSCLLLLSIFNFPFDQNGTSNLRRNCFANLLRNARDLNVSKRLLNNFWKAFIYLKILFKYNLLLKQTSFPVYKLLNDFINFSFHENKFSLFTNSKELQRSIACEAIRWILQIATEMFSLVILKHV